MAIDNTNTKKNARPFVKWVGGKSRLVPQILKYAPSNFGNYFEPFVGGGALFFATGPTPARLSDLNTALISAYKRIQNNVEEFIEELSRIEDEYLLLPTLEEKKIFYLEKRNLYNTLESTSLEKASLLIFLNKTCFNGMYRENKKGDFNVPFGKHLNPTICDATNLRNVSAMLKEATVVVAPYQEAVKTAVAGDFIYFDPPYHPLNITSSFTSYHADGFSEKDQKELRDTFKELSDRGCKVMLSNSDSEFIKNLYKDFNIHKIYAARSINSKGTKRGKIKEVLVTNF